jgi:D-alanine-D-alanine ligase
VSPQARSITLLYDSVEDEAQAEGEDTPVYRQVAKALSARGYSIQTIAAHPDLKPLLGALERDASDLIFNLCESLGGVDADAARVASLLELMGKPFTGAGSLGLQLAQDKTLAKKLFAFHGIRYPKFSSMQSGQVEWSDDLQFPLFVKPSDTDSSVGIDAGALVHNIKELMERISYIHTEFKSSVLIEEFIDGRELFVGVLGNDAMTALPIVEWDFSKVKGPKFATAEAKWNKASEGYNAPERFPTDIPKLVYSAIQNAAVDACKALRIFDYARVDMRVRRRDGGTADDPNNWEIYIIEANPNPYLDERSEVAMAAKEHGLSYADLLEQILAAAHKRVLRAA